MAWSLQLDYRTEGGRVRGARPVQPVSCYLHWTVSGKRGPARSRIRSDLSSCVFTFCTHTVALWTVVTPRVLSLSRTSLSLPRMPPNQTRGLAGGEVHVRRFVLPPRPLAALARVPRPLGRHALPVGIALPLVGAAAGGLQSVSTQHARTIRRRLNWRGTRTTHGSGCPPPSASSGPLLDNTSQRAARASHTPHRPHTHDIHE